MTFDIRLWLYPGVNPDSDPGDWGLEEDISAYIRRPGQDGGQSISYSAGKGDEAPSVDAGQMLLTLDNRDGRFSTDNIAGPYYGLLDINNPIRMGVVSYKDTFTRAASANGWLTPSTATGDVGGAWSQTIPLTNWTTDGSKGYVTIPAAATGANATALEGEARDVDAVMTVTPAAIATGARYAAGIRVRITATDTYLAAVLSFDLLGALRMEIYRFSTAGGGEEVASVNPLPSLTYTAGQQWKVRVQCEGRTIRAKAWAAAGAEPATWTIETTDSSTAVTGAGVGIYTARFGSNTNSGTNILTFDDFTVVALEFTGSVVSWPVRWDRSGNNSWTPIEAAGILRRIRQGTYPIQSPLRRMLASQANTTGYWPLEDGASAQNFSSVIQGVAAASFNGVTPAGVSDLAGGGASPSLDTATGLITGETRLVNGGSGFSAMCLFKMSSVPSIKTKIITFRCARGPVRRWEISANDANLYLDGIDADGTVLLAWSIAHGLDLSEWTAIQLETDKTIVPSNTSWALLVHRVGDTSFGSVTGTVLGTSDSTISSFILSGPAGTSFAHVWLGRNTLPFVTTEFSLVSSGYAGELAANRFARVCAEAGIPYILHPGASEAMGPQREGGTLGVLESCVQTDYGVMAERGAGLEYIPREARWNKTATMAISVAAGEIAMAPEPTRDDQRLRNRWTVARSAGGEGFYQDNDDILRHGVWEDSVTINAAQDSVLENHAGFRVAMGINQRLRWPSVALNFARSPHLLQHWRKREYGWRLTVETEKEQVQGNEPDLIVEGYRATLDPDQWMVDLNCSSASAWRAAVADDTGILGRADNEYCETTALISDTALAIPITTTSGTRWDNTASLWTAGVDFYIGGERVTVTSITNGVGQAQTLNCSARGVGGYAFTHATGTKVRLWDPAIVAL